MFICSCIIMITLPFIAEAAAFQPSGLDVLFPFPIQRNRHFLPATRLAQTAVEPLPLPASGDVTVELPRPLNLPTRVMRALKFWGSALPILGRYKLLEAWLTIERDVLEKTHDDDVVNELWTELHEWGSERLLQAIQDLKGFYVKTGQVISTRVDLFPEQYTSKLSSLQDSLDPMPFSLVQKIVETELLQGQNISVLFSEFDPEPLGSASIGQVHRAKLLDGREVAVKVQRPAIEAKLLGDIANLQAFALRLRSVLPVDYYTIFKELEAVLLNELDFLCEAQAMEKVAAAISHTPDNRLAPPPLIVPLPLPGLVSKRVLIMDYIDGKPLSRLRDEMNKQGILPGSPEAKFAAQRLLTSLTEAFARMIFGPGFIHGDPHPGNIFVLDNGQTALIDCGQVKQLTFDQQRRLAELIILVSEWENIYVERTAAERALEQATEDTDRSAREGLLANVTARLQAKVAEMNAAVRGFGVELFDGTPEEAMAACAVVLFGNSRNDTVLPGGFSGLELAPDSPIRRVRSFPQELVLLGRATVLIKGIASRVGVPWSLCQAWAPLARQSLALLSTHPTTGSRLPCWAADPVTSSDIIKLPRSGVAAATAVKAAGLIRRRAQSGDRPRFSEVAMCLGASLVLLRLWFVRKLVDTVAILVPQPLKRRLRRAVLRVAARLQGHRGEKRQDDESASPSASARGSDAAEESAA